MNNTREYVRTKARELYCLICSVLVVLAMNCKMECVIGARDSLLLNGIYKLRNSFYSFNFMDIFVVVAMFLLIRRIDIQGGVYAISIFAFFLDTGSFVCCGNKLF